MKNNNNMKLVCSNNGLDFDYYNKLEELIQLMRIERIRKIIFLKLEYLKEICEDDIEKLKRTSAKDNRDNLIFMNRDEYFSKNEDERLRGYFEFLMANEEYREAVINDFYSIEKLIHE